MRDLQLLRAAALLAIFAFALPSPGQTPAYRYYRVGNPADAAGAPKPGFALMGGGTDLDEAFGWLCAHAGGGDLVVLRATDHDDYNAYIQKLCKVNSVATIVLPSRAAANDPFVAKTIREASAIFISGGDQANYINYWMGTPVEVAVNEAIARGVPIGGTSAGLAVLGEYAYSAQGDKPDDPNLDGKTAMGDPFGRQITVVHGFLDIPILNGVITDTHFATRNRMGRLLVFLARLNADGRIVRGIGVEQRVAVLLEPDGEARVVGHGSAYFVTLKQPAEVLAAGKPMTLHNVEALKVKPGHVFNVKTWRGEAAQYTLNVDAGALTSTQAGGSVY
ncbi:MAG: cyanophycinase [Terracidiphilus sp.]